MDLRAEPKAGEAPVLGDHHQQTQLLHGERVHLLEEIGGWAYIEALEQPYYSSKGWQGYTGWVPLTALAESRSDAPQCVLNEYVTTIYQDFSCTIPLMILPMGASLDLLGSRRVRLACGNEGWIPFQCVSTPTVAFRELLLLRAQAFLDSPYFWGGCSPHAPHYWGSRCGVDCSGLVHILYRSLNTVVPRDAKDQARRSTSLSISALQPGDLIFTAPNDEPNKIDHVMLFVSSAQLLEATRQSQSCRYVTWTQKLGVSYEELCDGKEPSKLRVSAGTFLAA